MRVMVFVKATEDSEQGMMPSPQLSQMFLDMGKFDEDLVKAGILIGGGGLKPSSFGKRIAFDDPGRTVIDGPFAETRELVSSNWLGNVRDMDETGECVRRCPTLCSAPAKSKAGPSSRRAT